MGWSQFDCRRLNETSQSIGLTGVLGQNSSKQKGMDKMENKQKWYWTKWYGQRGTDKMNE